MPKVGKSNNTPSTSAIQNIVCSACGLPKKSTEFYASYSVYHAATQKVPFCKDCVKKMSVDELNKLDIEKLKNVLKQINKPFIHTLLQSTFNEVNDNSNGIEIVGIYMKSINSLPQYKKLGWEDSIFEKVEIQSTEVKFTQEDLQNQKDIVRLLKYDPFIDENNDIKLYLYNRLIDFLDENTLSDSFKLPIVIEIVKGFGQAERLNRALSKINISSDNVNEIKKLSETKNDILRSILLMAKDNGISENFSNNKSKGAGTLSGIIKDLQEKGIHASEINLYDIETCEGMKQVADISNKSILDQLMLNENDYVDMIKDQRSLIQELDGKYMKLDEENRILKVKIKSLEQHIKDINKIPEKSV
jgi:hypothetical protein